LKNAPECIVVPASTCELPETVPEGKSDITCAEPDTIPDGILLIDEYVI
jgi:hypothetical protein